jgi:hypothetical protein
MAAMIHTGEDISMGKDARDTARGQREGRTARSEPEGAHETKGDERRAYVPPVLEHIGDWTANTRVLGEFTL